jgi:hypothetical protein
MLVEQNNGGYMDIKKSEYQWKEILKQMENSTLKVYESIFEDFDFRKELKEKYNAEVRKQINNDFVVYSYHDIDSGKLKNISLVYGGFECDVALNNRNEIDPEYASTISFYKDSGLPCAFLMVDEETGKFATNWERANSSWFHNDKTSWENGECKIINFHETTGAVVGDLPQKIKNLINDLNVSNSVNKSVVEQAETKQNVLEEINDLWSPREVPTNFTGISNFTNGTKHWYLNGKLHRKDGPAVEYSDGSKEWHLNDMYHRVDGPAIERANGSREWWLNGKLHRVDGPACEYADGSKEWWLNGEYYSEAEWLAAKSVPQKTGEPTLTETVASRTMEPSQPVVNKTTETNDKPANGEKNKMSTMENIKEIAVSDAKVVAYRVAASQIGKVMTNAVIKLLSGNMKGKQLAGFRKNMTEFFQTPLGEALLMFMIGCATPFFIKYVPEKYRSHALKVAEAARHEAEFIAASKLMDSFMRMFSALEGLVSSSEEEEVEKIRVSPAVDNASERHEELSVSSPSARRAVG